MNNMQYRKLPHGGELISVIGLGMGYIHESGEKEIEETVRYAIEHGINYFDMVASEWTPYPAYGRAFKDSREKIYLQMHFGAMYDSGKYGWTLDMDKIQSNFKRELDALGTDYTDMGFVHCVDDEQDAKTILSGSIWKYIKSLKDSGAVRHIGLSSHNPEIVKRFLDTGLIDMVMFSINPAYDYSTGDYGIGSVSKRASLYRACEQAGVGISVMKPVGGGQLLDAKTSPFKKFLTKNQCIKYALDRPAVLTVLPGVRGLKDLKEILRYLDASPEDTDYSVIGTFAPQDADGICVYCNHCQPCPQGIDIGLINKYYDLSVAGDELAAGHYEKLSVKADACVMCGHCESRCPFHVRQETRMKEIDDYFSNLKA